MPKIDNPMDTVVKLGSIESNLSTKLSIPTDAILSSAHSIATSMNAYDIEVSYRPAAQQWVVCTP